MRKIYWVKKINRMKRKNSMMMRRKKKNKNPNKHQLLSQNPLFNKQLLPLSQSLLNNLLSPQLSHHQRHPFNPQRMLKSLSQLPLSLKKNLKHLLPLQRRPKKKTMMKILMMKIWMMKILKISMMKNLTTKT